MQLTTKRRWLMWLALAIVFSVACGFLANWQLSRRAQVLQVIERIDRNFNAKPVPLANVATKTDWANIGEEFRPVTVTGQYLTDYFLVRNRPLDGQPGFEQLVPFLCNDGRVILVNRGWLPTGNRQDLPDILGLPSTKQQTVVARIRLGEPDLNRAQPPKWQLASIDLLDARRQIGFGASKFFTGIYLALDTEQIAVADSPRLLERPQITEGNHLSYAFQWVIFALMAFFALGWAVRQERNFKRSQNDPTYVVKTRRKVGDADKEAEDAIS